MVVKHLFKAMIKRILGKIARNSKWYNQLMFGDCDKFWNLKDNVYNIVNLGSFSAKYAFNYSSIDLVAGNWAMGPQSFLFDLAILKSHIGCIKKNGVVLIPICPFSCLVGYDTEEFMKDKYYTIVNPEYLPVYSRTRHNEVELIKNDPLHYIPLMQFIAEIKKLVSFSNKKRNIQIREDKMEADAQNWIMMWKELFNISDFSKPLSSQNNKAYKETQDILCLMVNYIKENGLTPVIVLPPIFSTLRNKFNSELMHLLVYDFLKDSVGDKALFLDYTGNTSYDNPEYYYNSYFMNNKGASLFTKNVINDLRIRKII